MAADKLLANPFWNKKIDLSIKCRDADKDGQISQADLSLLFERFITTANPPEDKVVVAKQYLNTMLEKMGLSDPNARISFDDVKKLTAAMVDTPERKKSTDTLFNLLDLDEDGMIGFNDWEIGCKSHGIDTAYARGSFDAMDTDKTGKIGKDMFVNYHDEFYYSTEDKLNSSILYGPLDQ